MNTALSATSLNSSVSAAHFPATAQRLAQLRRGAVGRILAVCVHHDAVDHDLERGLLEMGFVEGAAIEVLHHGLLGRDPLAVRINRTITVALRRAEADAVLVDPLLTAESSTNPAYLAAS